MKTRRAATGPRNPVIRALLQNPSRAIRRHEDKRAKAEASRKWAEQRSSWTSTHDDPTPRQVGKAASTHNRACSCGLCKADSQRLTNIRLNAATSLQFESDHQLLALLDETIRVENALEDERYMAERQEYDRKAWAEYQTMRRYVDVQEWVSTAPDKWVLRTVKYDSDDDWGYRDHPYSTYEKAYISIDRATEQWLIRIPSFTPGEGITYGETHYPYYEHSLDQMQGIALLLLRVA